MITKLNFTTNQLDFNLKLKKYKAIWKGKFHLKSFTEYFEKQWPNSQFKNWRVFDTPNVYSSTNNPLKRYNRTIKDLHTKRYKLSMHEACDVFKCAVEYESKQFVNMTTERLVTKKDENKAMKFTSFKKLSSINNNEYKYLHKNKTYSILNIDKKSCSCSQQVDIGICSHLIRLFYGKS